MMMTFSAPPGNEGDTASDNVVFIDPDSLAVGKLVLFKNRNQGLLARADKQIDILLDDMNDIYCEMLDVDGFPVEKMPALLSRLYRHIMAFKITVGLLSDLLADEDEDTCAWADFMDDYLDVLLNASEFLYCLDDLFTDETIGALCEYEEEDEEDEEDEYEDEDDEEWI